MCTSLTVDVPVLPLYCYIICLHLDRLRQVFLSIN